MDQSVTVLGLLSFTITAAVSCSYKNYMGQGDKIAGIGGSICSHVTTPTNGGSYPEESVSDITSEMQALP